MLQTVSVIAPIHLSLCFDVLSGTKHPTAARCHSLHIPTYSYIFLRIPPTYLLPYRVAYQFPTYLHCSHIKKTRLTDEKKFASISPITRSSASCFSFRSTGFLTLCDALNARLLSCYVRDDANVSMWAHAIHVLHEMARFSLWALFPPLFCCWKRQFHACVDLASAI